MLEISGVNYVVDILVNIVGTSFFNEVMHNFFSLSVVAMRGEENAESCAINVMAISGKIFLPVKDGGIDMSTPLLWDSGVKGRFVFELVKTVFNEVIV